MSETLKCKVCGQRHRLADPHIWPDEKAEPKSPDAALKRLAELEAREAARLAKDAAYMRGYRAKIKAAR